MKIHIIPIVLLCGCTIVGHKPPPQGWPTGENMKVTTTYKSLWATHQDCSFNGGLVLFLLAPRMACAHIVLSDTCDTGTCDKVLSSEVFAEHEQDHCEGRDHFGSTEIADYFQSCLDKHNPIIKNQ